MPSSLNVATKAKTRDKGLNGLKTMGWGDPHSNPQHRASFVWFLLSGAKGPISLITELKLRKDQQKKFR